MKLLHSVAVQERAISADGVEVFDLPVNPLSVVLVCLRPLNDTGTLTDFARYLALVGAVNRATVVHRGSAIRSMSGRDQAAMNYYRHGIMPKGANEDDVNNERRLAVLPIIFGRFAYDPTSCLPASRRGELSLELDLDIADTGYDGLRLSVETVELLDARPTEFERQVSIARTFAATGEASIELPLGNVVRGLLLFGTTTFAGAAPAPTWGRVGVRVDNEEHSYASTDFEVASMLTALMGRQPPALDNHAHQFEPVAGVETLGTLEQGQDGWANYAYLDFDPTRDDTFSIDASKASSVQITSNVETADAARVIPVERMPVSVLS